MISLCASLGVCVHDVMSSVCVSVFLCSCGLGTRFRSSRKENLFLLFSSVLFFFVGTVGVATVVARL